MAVSSDSIEVAKESIMNEVFLDELLSFMTGSFDSSAQAESDSNYYNISLEMHPVWEAREGHWLYVEQALAAKKDKPYRQRMYKVSYDKVNKNYVSAVYKLPNEKDYIGMWQDEIFSTLKEEDLILRSGCAVFLGRDESGAFIGSTNDSDCESTLRGATYATSLVSIYKDRIESWDQGFNDSGEQVWGAVEGPYIFNKLN